MSITQANNLCIRLLIGSAIGVLLLAVSAVTLPIAKAATLTVTTLADTDNGGCGSTCSLRDAIFAAGAGDTITFSVAGTITLASNLPNPAVDLAIVGPAGGVTIDGGNLYRSGFAIPSGITVTVSNLTFANGFMDTQEGAAFYNNGTLVIANSTFSNNSTKAGGGAIYSTFNLSITHTTFISNAASYLDPADPGLTELASGGAIFVYSGPATIANSTFSHNHAPIQGGAIYTFPGASLSIDASTFYSNTTANSLSSGGGALVIFQSTLAMTNSTLVDNTASVGGALINWNSTSVLTNTTIAGNTSLYGPGSGGGIDVIAGTVTVRNSILANNTGGNCTSIPGIANGGFNIQFGGGSENSCGASIPTKDPKLEPLGDYGGPTQTLALGPDSPALDMVPLGSNGCGVSVRTDQRGILRPHRSGCDSGAFEADYSWLYLPLLRR